ncbi:hypothetical protein F4801DRAFT_598649 [Xylaria longipes]|nr:hypothetical protein F4801DRAFT_598649 [Xylaria longipes]RYC66061.1 hypothetical protein CHU98_g104 [Xylaria longipes]
MSSKHSMNFYDLLGVAPNADVPTIERAFKAISLEKHPDKANAATRPQSGVESQDELEAREKRNNERYVRIVEARDTLLDDRKRKAYDKQQGIRNPSANDDRKPKDYPSRSESKSKSDTKSKSRSSAKSGADYSANGLIESYLDILEAQVSFIKDLDRKIHDMMYILERATSRSSHGGPEYSETTSLLESILRKSREAKEDIYDAIEDLESLGRRSLADSKKRSEAKDIYYSATDGALDYLHKAEKTVDELQSVVRPLEDRWR